MTEAPVQLSFEKQLRKGMKSRDVEAMQRRIDEINGFYRFCGRETLAPTGYFGDETQHFVRAFQSFAEINPSGVFDFKTYQSLNAKFDNYVTEINEACRKRFGSEIWNN